MVRVIQVLSAGWNLDQKPCLTNSATHICNPYADCILDPGLSTRDTKRHVSSRDQALGVKISLKEKRANEISGQMQQGGKLDLIINTYVKARWAV